MTDLRLDVYTSPMRDLSNGGQFSPTTATLVLGPTEAVLLDTQYMERDVVELARRIMTSGRTLTAIYVTHGHADHYFGLERLLDRFPQARPLALPAVAAGIAAGNETARIEWAERFGGEALDNTVVPEPLEGETITVDGQPLHAINVGQADIANNTVVTFRRLTPSSPVTSSTTASTRSSPRPAPRSGDRGSPASPRSPTSNLASSSPGTNDPNSQTTT
jgi:hypothetical protein